MRIAKSLLIGLGVFVGLPSKVWAASPIDRFIGSYTGGQCIKEGEIPEISGIFCVLVNIINYLLTVSAVVAFIMLVYGGLQYMISGGDEKAITAAKSTVQYSVFGLLVILGAILIINTVISTLVK